MVERTMSLGVGGNGEISGVRETMWAQQERLQMINQELDAEREASSSAASEALSMILRLQGEKAALQMEASQYKRMAEEKMCHAETSLELFEDLIYQKEMEIASLEFQVQAYRCKLLSLGCSDPAVIGNKFPENLIFYSEASRVNQKRKMKRNLSSPFDGMTSERSLILSDSNGGSFEEKKLLETSLSPRQDLNTYWEEIRRIDEHVREISDSRDAQKETKFPLLRRESMSHAIVSQVSNTILESAKSDVSLIMEMMKNPEKFSVKDASLETPGLSPNVQDVFEVTRTQESLTMITEEKELEKGNVRGSKMMSSNYDRKVSKPPRDTSIKADHLSLLKEIREQLNEMQADMRSLRSELHQSQPVSHRQDDRALQSIQEAMLHFWL